MKLNSEFFAKHCAASVLFAWSIKVGEIGPLSLFFNFVGRVQRFVNKCTEILPCSEWLTIRSRDSGKGNLIKISKMLRFAALNLVKLSYLTSKGKYVKNENFLHHKEFYSRNYFESHFVAGIRTKAT